VASPVQPQRVGGSGTGGITVLVAVVVVLIALAELKPWQSSVPATAASPTPSPAVASAAAATPPAAPGPSADPLAAALNRRQCQSGAGWRLVTLQEWGDRTWRTLFDVDPGQTRTQAAAEKVAPRVLADVLQGIGYCPPGLDPSSRAASLADVTVWAEVDGAKTASRLAGLRPLDADLYQVGEAYLAPPRSIAVDGGWPPGRYLFQVAPSQGAPEGGWFALTVTSANG
jgi:hypothetical protein